MTNEDYIKNKLSTFQVLKPLFTTILTVVQFKIIQFTIRVRNITTQTCLPLSLGCFTTARMVKLEASFVTKIWLSSVKRDKIETVVN